MLLDFVGLITHMNEPIEGISATSRIKSIGAVKRNFRDSMGMSTSIETTDYYVPEADIMMFRPQGYFGKNAVQFFFYGFNGTILTLPNQLALCLDYHKGINLAMDATIPFPIVQCVWNLMPL